MDSTNEPKNQEKEGAEKATTTARDDYGKKLEACEKDREEYLNGWKRAKADLINYQKDEAKRFEEVVRFANEGMVKDLLRVLDSFELGESVFKKDRDVEKGTLLIRSQLMDILKRQGVEEIVIHPGKPLDPATQEAIMEVESDGESGTVQEVVERGYKLHGTVIRPARVTVAKEKK